MVTCFYKTYTRHLNCNQLRSLTFSMLPSLLSGLPFVQCLESSCGIWGIWLRRSGIGDTFSLYLAAV